MLGGVPANLSAGARVLENAASSARDSALAVDAAAGAGRACGDSPVGPALDRFTAAWSGELLSWALGATQMSQVASQSGEAITAVTGGLSWIARGLLAPGGVGGRPGRPSDALTPCVAPVAPLSGGRLGRGVARVGGVVGGRRACPVGPFYAPVGPLAPARDALALPWRHAWSGGGRRTACDIDPPCCS